jgi:hypothetical protein
MSWSIVMMENPVIGPKFRPFHIISLVDCLALCNEFTTHFILKKVMSHVFIFDFDM